MSTFKEFMNEAEKSPTTALSPSNNSLSVIQVSLMSAVGSILTPFAAPNDKKQEFAAEASNLVRDEAFISEFSERIGEPSELETEDKFVERGSDVLRKMLYTRFGIKG